MKKNTRELTEDERRAIWTRDGGKCQDCSSEVGGIGENNRSKPYHRIHHVRPRRANGSNDPDNLVLLCSGCHGTRESEEKRINHALRYWYQDLPASLRELIEAEHGNYESYLPDIKIKRGHTYTRPARQKAAR